MEISCPDGRDGGRRNLFPATHAEIHPTNILSVVGNLTPWSDHNQSPRNMYQCQVLPCYFCVLYFFFGVGVKTEGLVFQPVILLVLGRWGNKPWVSLHKQ